MNTTKKIDRSELAIWAEGTIWTTDELVDLYDKYLSRCNANGTEPLDEGRWANEEMCIENEQFQ